MLKCKRILVVLAAVAAGSTALSAQTVMFMDRTVRTENVRCESRNGVGRRSSGDFRESGRWSVRAGIAVPSYTASTCATGSADTRQARSPVRLYGKLGFGAVKYFGFDRRNFDSVDGDVEFYDNSFTPGIQFAPFGIELGRKIFGFAEIGVGTLYRGISAGLGYKF